MRPTSRPHRQPWRLPATLLGLPVAVAAAGAGAGAGAGMTLPPGSYAITAQVIMPHMEEMRRRVTNEQRCITGNDPRALFPVMRQPALRGCALEYPVQADDGAWTYVMVCQTARVATGTATISQYRGRLVGMLEVKMGGKNMTFSQRIEAVHSGSCGVQEAATPLK